MNTALARLVVGIALTTSGCWQSVTPWSPDGAACTATLEALPAREPYTFVTIRGTACDAAQIEVERNGTDPTVATVGLDGSYCIDVLVATPGPYTFAVYASHAGTVSSLGTVTTVVDPTAPPIVGAATCGGFDPANCNAVGVCR